MARAQCFAKRMAVGRRTERQRAAFAIFDDDAHRGECRASAFVVEEDARPNHPALEGRNIRPAIAVEIAAALAVVAAKHRPRPVAGRRLGVPAGDVPSGSRRRVQQELVLGRPGPLRHQIDDASQRR